MTGRRSIETMVSQAGNGHPGAVMALETICIRSKTAPGLGGLNCCGDRFSGFATLGTVPMRHIAGFQFGPQEFSKVQRLKPGSTRPG